VSATNLVFNVVAIPSGIWGYVREGRLVWPLTVAIVLGTLPGVVAGGLIRVRLLPDPGPFKMFVGCVLLYIGTRLVRDVWGRRRPVTPTTGQWDVKITESTWRRLAYSFQGEEYHCSVPLVFLLALVVGVVGGVYGVGGGSIVAPFLVAIFGLPVHTIAGATLAGTFVTSIVGVAFFQFVAPLVAAEGTVVTPDWALGALFGLGGFLGMYAGARLQRHLPARWLKLLLVVVLLWVAARYVGGFLLAGR
jgi:uncharacterized membrane protein YfcA